MIRALKIAAISVAVVIAGIFAVYCKMGFFDFIWRATADVVVPIVIVLMAFCIGWYAGSRVIAPLLRKWGS